VSFVIKEADRLKINELLWVVTHIVLMKKEIHKKERKWNYLYQRVKIGAWQGNWSKKVVKRVRVDFFWPIQKNSLQASTNYKYIFSSSSKSIYLNAFSSTLPRSKTILSSQINLSLILSFILIFQPFSNLLPLCIHL